MHFIGTILRGMIPIVILSGLAATGTVRAAVTAGTEVSEQPVGYCDWLSRPYHFVPYLQSCLRVDGIVRANVIFTEHGERSESVRVDRQTDTRIFVDTWNATELGTMRTYTVVNGKTGLNSGITIDQSYVRIANFAMGKRGSLANLYFGSFVFEEFEKFELGTLNRYDPNDNVWSATYNITPGQGLRMGMAFEQPVGFYVDNGEFFLQPDNSLPDITANAILEREWGIIGAAGGIHSNQTRNYLLLSNLLRSIDDFSIYSRAQRMYVDSGVDCSDNTEFDRCEFVSKKYGSIGYFGGLGFKTYLSNATNFGMTGYYTEGALNRIGIRVPLLDAYLRNDRLVNSVGYSIKGGLSHTFGPSSETGYKYRANFDAGYFLSVQGFDRNNSKANSHYFGASLNYLPYPGIQFTIGGMYESNDLSKFQSPIPKDSDGNDTLLAIVGQITHAF